MERVIEYRMVEADRARRRGDEVEHRRLVREAAGVHRSQGDHAKAIDLLLSVRDYTSAALIAEHLEDWPRAAQIWFRDGSFERAAASFARCGEYHQAADLYAQVRDHGRAARMYAKAGEPMRAAAEFERSGEVGRAAQCYVVVLKSPTRYGVAGSDAERICRAAALCFEAAGEIDRAVRILEIGDQRLLAAEVLRRAGRAPEAERLTDELTAMQGAEVLLARARAGERGCYAQVLQMLAVISEEQNGYRKARVLMAQALVEDGDPECAMRVLKRLLDDGRFGAEDLGALYLYAKLLVAEGREGEARGALRSVVAIDPDYEDANGILAELGDTGKLLTIETMTLAQTMVPTTANAPSRYEGLMLRERFRVEELLGEGAQAAVYGAHDLVLDRRVAIKILAQDAALDPSIAESFLQEARFAARVHHRGCLAVYDFGVDQGAVFMAMARSDGHTLADTISGGPVAFRTALAIVREVASALAAIHDAGIVHRDVKPANILIERGGAVRLADFGIATSLDGADHLDDQPRLGTLRYMAPEQADPTCIDVRSDVYALGVVLYEMLTGAPPFEGSVASLVARLLQPAPSIDAQHDVPGYVESLVRRCLEPDPEDRWPSMRALFAALDEACARGVGASASRRLVVPHSSSSRRTKS